MELYFIGIAIFVAAVLAIEGLFLFLRTRDRWNPELKRVRKELTSLSNELFDPDIDLTRKKKPLSDVPWLNAWLSRIPCLHRINDLLVQADFQQSLGLFLLLSLFLGLAVFAIFQVFIRSFPLAVLIGIVAGLLPFFYVHLKKSHRMKKFEQQLPDALTLIARALKAGHAFSGGLHMVTQEFDNPIGGEFEKVLNEINFGIGLDEALANLSHRMDCPDLKFFAISIIIQKETGGNLAEILENISFLIRERFKLHGRVKALSAEGKLSAYILIAVPFLFAAVLGATNPQFLRILTTDPIGQTLVGCALAMMVVGFIMMKRMVDIQV